jgi:hypothetical protein
MPIATVKSERKPDPGYKHAIQPNYRHNGVTIAVRPVNDIWLDTPPEHNELCSIVWTRGRRLVKYISKACPHHGKVKCITEKAH